MFSEKYKSNEVRLGFSYEEFEKIFQEEIFDPEKLITILSQEYPGVYEKDAGVFEKYTLKQHTLMVMRQFEKYFKNTELPGGVNKNFFRFILALHDIGKPEAISQGGKHLQHEFTQKYVQELFGKLNIDEKNTKLALVLTSDDPIGKYLIGKINLLQAKELIAQLATAAQMPVDDFFQLLCIYYKVDAGSYTEDAGGIKSLDRLFNFEEGKLDFSRTTQERIDLIGIGK